MKQPISSLVVIHSSDGYFLLLERAKQPGFWQSVTGSREGEETPRQTACREVMEETGIKVAQGVLHDWQMQETYTIWETWRHRYAQGVTHNTEHWFSLCLPPIAKVRDWVRLQPEEHINAGWYRADEAVKKCFSPSNQKLIEWVDLKCRKS